MTEAVLRPATAADAEEVAQIWLDGWRDGHVGHVPDALVAVRTPESFTQRAFDYAAVTGSGSTPVPCHRFTARTERLSRRPDPGYGSAPEPLSLVGQNRGARGPGDCGEFASARRRLPWRC
jgi:hypothetical protein